MDKLNLKVKAIWNDEINADDFSLFSNALHDVVFVLRDDNDNIVAYADVQDVYDIDEIADASNLRLHHVAVKHERRGYGSALISALQARYDYLEAAEVMEAARGFWAKMGFADSGEDADGVLYAWTR